MIDCISPKSVGNGEGNGLSFADLQNGTLNIH